MYAVWKAVLTVAVPAVLALSPCAQAADEPVYRPVLDKWALVIGVSKYADSAIDLKYASKDARDFRDYLVNEAHFAPDHVRLLVDQQATRENILAAIGDKWLPRVAEPDDLVVIYVSSHGSPSRLDVEGVNYIVAHNTQKDSLYATGIPIQEFTGIVRERVHAGRIVLVLDACHSGAVKTDAKGLYRQSNFDANEIAQGTGQLVICSSEPSQVSWESKTYANSVFTRQLIEGLRQKGDQTTLGEAYDYMRDAVRHEVLRDRGQLQVPVFKTKWEGREMALAAAPVKPRPGLPEDPPAITPPLTAEPEPEPIVTRPPKAPAPAPAPVARELSLVVLDFTPPAKVDSGSSLGFKLRTGQSGELEDQDFASLGSELQRLIVEKLKTVLGDKVARVQDVHQVETGSESGTHWARVAQRTGAKYILTGSVDEASFDGHLFGGDQYEIIYSAKLISAASGQVVWRVSERKIEKKLMTPKEKDPIAVFSDNVLAAAAEQLATRVTASLGVR